MLIISACTTTEKTTTSSSGNSGYIKVPDGSSPEQAIVVNSVSEEYDWLQDHYPGYKFHQQALLQIDGKPYDALTFKYKGKKQTIYFDISSFFGKW